MTNRAPLRVLSIALAGLSIVSGTVACGGGPDATAGNIDGGEPTTSDGGMGREDSGAESDGGAWTPDAGGATPGDGGQSDRTDAGPTRGDAGQEDDGGASVADAGNGPSDAGADAAGPALGKVVGGYYPNWTPSPVRIKDIDAHYNVVYLFAATPASGSGGSGAIAWTPPGDGLGAATNLNADIAYARQTQGRKIILSIGGAGNNVSFPNRTTSQTFLTSLAGIYTQLGGFDGIDWDSYEGTDAPDTSEMIWISLQLKSMYPGFLITTPPAPWSTVDQTFCAQMAAAGALDYAAPQYYDGPNLATQSYIVPSVDTWAGLVGSERLVVGFGVANATNYMTVAQVVSTWNAVIGNHPTLRGAFDWQIDVDQSSGWPFADQVGPLVNP